MSLGNRLRELRKEKELTIREIAKIFNLGETTISNYENNVRKPDFETLLKFADFYGVTIDYLLGTTDDKNIYLTIERIPPELREVGVTYMALAKEMEDKEIPPEDIKKLIEVIENIKK